MEPGTSTDIRLEHEATTTGDNEPVALPGARHSQRAGEREPESPDQESHIIRGED
ncbi:hypothetical protein ACFYXF_09845 [Streptomyces sp. NPDC002680]|uniref:hypothetical protein n=1 Tax=Streptomyces sp. NPDC002680 TaxID=3364659 RepID=UPI0036C91E73